MIWTNIEYVKMMIRKDLIVNVPLKGRRMTFQLERYIHTKLIKSELYDSNRVSLTTDGKYEIIEKGAKNISWSEHESRRYIKSHIKPMRLLLLKVILRLEIAKKMNKRCQKRWQKKLTRSRKYKILTVNWKGKYRILTVNWKRNMWKFRRGKKYPEDNQR